jgi:exodeoxyribonuclease-5
VVALKETLWEKDMSMELKGQQAAAFDAAMRWFKTPARERKQCFVIYGGAGVGKTTLAKKFKEFARCHFMTLSGKAALVMRKKGCDGATTVHSAIYKLVDDDGIQPHFELNLDSETLKGVELIILDELGMIDEEIGQDIMAFGIPVLAMGDLNQLPPPSDRRPYFDGTKPDYVITEILRQAKDSPIITLAYQALETGKLVPGSYGDSRVFSSSIKDSKVREIMLAADQVLCGKNATRVYNSQLMRRWKGLAGEPIKELPTVGERLVCLRNNHKKGILNGEQFKLTEILDQDLGKVVAFKAASLDSGNDREIELAVPWNWWQGTESNLPQWEKANYDQFFFADVMTVHKYQGSQADYIAILDESGAFRENKRKHLYTAITRAAVKVDVLL